MNCHEYTSTACYHGKHAECRLQCKFCAAKCRCLCHGPSAKDVETLRAEVDSLLERIAQDRVKNAKGSK